MATKTTTALETPLRQQLDRLAGYDPAQGPVISLYLDLRPDQNGQRTHAIDYMRRALEAHADLAARLERHVLDTVPRSASACAIFAATTGDLFESIPMDAPLERHEMFLGPVPHLYPLARVNDQYPRYAAVLLDTNSARLFVFALGATEREEAVQNEKTRRSAMGGWSQARYQRRADNMAKAHIKEVVDALDRLVTDERINQIIVACDDTTRPFLTAELPKHLADKVLDVMRMDVKNAPVHAVLAGTLDALRQQDAKSDAEEADKMIGAWRAGGLAVCGVEPTLQALERRQVEALLISANPAMIPTPHAHKGDALPIADQLVARAQQNAARIRFIEDDALLADVGGVGAILRFKIC